MMKKITIMCFAIAIGFGAFAQDKAKGIQFYEYQKYQSAIQELSPLAESDDYANYYLGLSYIALEDLNKAKAIFQKYADDPANMAGLARIMFLEEKDAEAKSMLENVTRKASRRDKRPYLYAADAITYTDGGDLNKAHEWYDYYLEWKKSPSVLIRKGDAYRKQLDGGKAMSAYQNAGEQGGELSLSAYKQGNLWYAAKTYDSALANYQRAADLDENNPLPYYDLANAYYRINKYDRAKEQIEKYLALSDKSPEDKMQYANILYLAKDYDGAIAKMNELIASGTVKSYMYRVLGYSFHEKKDSAKALANMELLFKKHPEKKLIAQDYFTYGKILSKTEGRKSEAEKYFIEYVNREEVEKPDTRTDYAKYNDLKVGDSKSSLDELFGISTNVGKSENIDVFTYELGDGIISATITNGKITALSQIGLSKTESNRHGGDRVKMMREIAEYYKEIDDYANAAIWYKKVTEQNTPSVELLDYWWAGRSFYQVSDYVNAKDMYAKLVAKYPDQPTGYYWSAKVDAAQDPDYKTGVATDMFKKYITMAEGDDTKSDDIVNASVYIAVVAYNQQKYDEAKKYANMIISLKPDNGTAKQILAGIPK